MGKLSRLKTQGQRNRTSKREKEIHDILKQIFPCIIIWSEYPLSQIIPDCNNNSLRVDLYSPTINVIWEVDGEGHSVPMIFGNSEEEIQEGLQRLKEQKERDSYKDRLCKDAGVNLVRIPYYEWDELKTDDEKRTYLMEKL